MKGSYILILFLFVSCLYSCKPQRPEGGLMKGIRPYRDATQTHQEAGERNEDLTETFPSEITEAQDITPEILLPAPLADRNEHVLQYTGFTVSYNSDRLTPNWVAWCLTANHTDGPFKRKGRKFHTDEKIASRQAWDSDYSGSGYDRGHMCPSGDNKWSNSAQSDCFTLTNICPQSHTLNSGDWNDLELQCRRWAHSMGDLHIVCGPIYTSAVPRTIGKNKVCVPDAFYKVIVCLEDNARGIAFIYKNEDGHREMRDYVTSISHVEELTGIDFFPELDDALENRLEQMQSLEEFIQ